MLFWRRGARMILMQGARNLKLRHWYCGFCTPKAPFNFHTTLMVILTPTTGSCDQRMRNVLCCYLHGENAVCFWRWFTVTPSRTEVQHSRPGQRFPLTLMCSVVQRCMVVRCMSRFQPERSLPERQSHLVRWQCHLVKLERRALLSEIHWDEDQAVLTTNYLTSYCLFSMTHVWPIEIRSWWYTCNVINVALEFWYGYSSSLCRP